LYNNCPKCNDFGYLHPVLNGVTDYSRVVLCECVRQEMVERKKAMLLSSCALPPYGETMTLEAFKVYPELKTAYDAAYEMAQHPGLLTWLALIGENGNGKTHLGISVCRSWIMSGVAARYALTSILLDELRDGFRQDEGRGYKKTFDYYCNIPLLLLDDCGIESKTAWVQEKLETIIDYRLMNNLSLIITSNQSLDEMPARIRSRLTRHPKSKIIAVKAVDYALRK